MLALFGPEETIRNVYCVSHRFLGDRVPTEVADLRSPFLRFLAEHQPYLPLNNTPDLFITDQLIETRLAQAYAHNNAINDLRQAEIIGPGYSAGERARKREIANRALDVLLERDAAFGAIFFLVVHTVFIRPSTTVDGRQSYGGSSSAALGAIWLSIPEGIGEADVAELLVHELVHHLLFVDERRHNHFNYRALGDSANFAYSAILKLNRPLDKVVHSIVVGTELILARRRGLLIAPRVTVHPKTEDLKAAVLAAYQSVCALPYVDQVISPRVREILERCQTAVEAAA